MKSSGTLITALSAALILTGATAAAPKSTYPPPAPEMAETDTQSPPPSAAMQDKFRKLQKEMESDPAAPPSPEKPVDAPQESIKLGSLTLQILFGLAFVLLLAIATIRGLKRMQSRLLSRPGKGGDILEVLESCHLGPQQKVIALRMNDDVGIIGVTKEGISLLTVLKEPVDELRKARAGESNSAAFSDNLNKLLDRFKKPKKVSELLDEEPRT